MVVEANDRSAGNDCGVGLPLTERSEPGMYFVITLSRTLYEVEVRGGGLTSTITRHPIQNALLLDKEPLTGVRSFFFDPASGLGQIEWWKNNGADYDHPDREYFGTVRTTSHVMAVLHVHSVQDHMETPSREDHRLETQELSDGLCCVLSGVDGDEEFLVVLRELAQRGSGSFGAEAHDDDPGGGVSG